MKRQVHFALTCAVVLFALKPAFAADGAPALATQGKQLFEDKFERDDMKPKWLVGKGFFTVKDGVVSIAENPADNHGAYAYVTPSFVFKDIVAEFSVKLSGARSCSLMINDSNYTESHAGHIIKAAVYRRGNVEVADWKLGRMRNDIYEKLKDTKTTADEKKQVRDSIKDKSADSKANADFSAWRVVRVEIVGSEMLLSVDGKAAGYLKSDGIDHPTKDAIGFEIGGKFAEIKDMKVWEATASKDWPAARDGVIASIGK